MFVRELELDLDAFEGPFDLLLTLVLREEIDLAEIDVAGIIVPFIERFRALLRRRTLFDFDQEVAGLERVEIAVAFLALLELRKSGEISIQQAAPFAPIRIARADVERSLSWNVRSA